MSIVKDGNFKTLTSPITNFTTLTANTIVATDLVIPSITTPIINCLDVFASNSVNSLLLNSTIINAEDELKIPVIPTISGFPLQARGSIVQDSGSSILYISNGSAWIGGSSTGITSINGDVNSAQFITIGSSGNLLNTTTTGGITKINIPKASAIASGIITTGNQEFSGNKIFKNDLTVSGIFTANGITGVITSINGNLNSAQLITIGTSGNFPNISNSVGGTTKINIPRASLTNSGIITTGTQSFSGNKTFSNVSSVFTGRLKVNSSFISSGLITSTNTTESTSTTSNSAIKTTGGLSVAKSINASAIYGKNRLNTPIGSLTGQAFQLVPSFTDVVVSIPTSAISTGGFNVNTTDYYLVPPVNGYYLITGTINVIDTTGLGLSYIRANIRTTTGIQNPATDTSLALYTFTTPTLPTIEALTIPLTCVAYLTSTSKVYMSYFCHVISILSSGDKNTLSAYLISM